MSHSQLNPTFAVDHLPLEVAFDATDGQFISLTAIRTCYSSLDPSEILNKEGKKYLIKKDNQEADYQRLLNHIVHSGHLSTLEHMHFTFCIAGISRSCLAQLTRHRIGFSFSVQSQRYVRFASTDKSKGFHYVIPDSIEKNEAERERVERIMQSIQAQYDALREAGIAAEDARMVLPNAAATNLVMSGNARALLDFYRKRKAGTGAQSEITKLAMLLKEQIIDVEPWLSAYFE